MGDQQQPAGNGAGRVLGQVLPERVLRQAPTGIVACDAGGEVVLVNAEARRLAGLDPQGPVADVEWSAWGAAYDRDGNEILSDRWSLRRALRGESVTGHECHMVRADGSEYDLLVNAAPLTGDAGQVVGAVAALIDISAQKEAERQLREAQDRVSDQREQLAAVGQVAAGVAHEFNDLLQTVMANAEILAQHVQPGDRTMRNVEALLRETSRGSVLVRQILELAGYRPGAPLGPDRTDHPADTQVQGGGGRVVLVVEDEQAVRGTLTEGLSEFGYTVMTAVDGEAGLELFEAHRDEISVVVSDVVMPRMDGFNLAREVKARAPGVAVVLMTGHPLRQDEAAAPEVDGWLHKPFALERLCEAVARAAEMVKG